MEVEERVERRRRGEWQASKGAILLTLDGGGFGVWVGGMVVVVGWREIHGPKLGWERIIERGLVQGPPFLKI